MNTNDELTKELAKNKADEIIIKEELENFKIKFIDEIRNITGEEIASFDFNAPLTPIKYKKPLKIKIKDFFNKIGKVLDI